MLVSKARKKQGVLFVCASLVSSLGIPLFSLQGSRLSGDSCEPLEREVVKGQAFKNEANRLVGMCSTSGHSPDVFFFLFSTIFWMVFCWLYVVSRDVFLLQQQSDLST